RSGLWRPGQRRLSLGYRANLVAARPRLGAGPVDAPEQDLGRQLEMLAHQRDRPIGIARQRGIHDRSMLLVDVALGAGQGHGEAPVALGLVEQLRAQAKQPRAVASVYQREMEVGMPLQPP